MITSKDIKNLAELARIEVSDAEAEHLTSEIDSILQYIGQTKNAIGGLDKNIPVLRNVLREDVPTNKKREYTENLLEIAPSREGDYFKVKKIL